MVFIFALQRQHSLFQGVSHDLGRHVNDKILGKHLTIGFVSVFDDDDWV